MILELKSPVSMKGPVNFINISRHLSKNQAYPFTKF